MRAAGNAIRLVAHNDCGHPLFADTRVLDQYDPVWLCTRAKWSAISHALCTSSKSVRVITIRIFVFSENIAPVIVLRKTESKVPECFQSGLTNIALEPCVLWQRASHA